MEFLFLVPARAGSKGLAEKNLRPIAGIPLVARAVRLGRRAISALGARARLVCSTEDERIATTAREWGAEIPFTRPAALARDETPSSAVVLHALGALGERWDAVVLLQPTSPLTEVEDVLGAIQLFRRTGDPVVSICETEHPVAWAMRMSEGGRLSPVVALPRVGRRQETETAYRPNGAVYVARPEQIRQFGGFLDDSTRGYRMPRERSVDIDSEGDLRLADAMLAAREVATVPIGPREIGPRKPCLVVAEAGVNHNGSLELAHRLVDAAADVGADAVKFQTYVTERVCATDAPKAAYQSETTGGGSQFEMLKRLELPYAWHGELKRHAAERGILFLSTPDDVESARFLCDIGVPAIKVGSGELTNLPFLRELAELGKPLLLSTGMATMADVAHAVDATQETHRVPIALLHCVSSYPAPEEELNLRCISSMRASFGVPVGLSDHTTSDAAAIIGMGYEMAILEKHLTLDRALPGPDHRMSYDPERFKELVRLVRQAGQMIGTGAKAVTPSEAATLGVVRRALTYAATFEQGHVLRTRDLVALRAKGGGLAPDVATRLVGRALKRRVMSGSAVSEADVS